MKVFARNQLPRLSVVPRKQVKPAAGEFVTSGGIRDSFHGWLDTIAPTLAESVNVPSTPRIPRLTVLDIMRVNHATVREGESHCVWPPFVVEKFKASDVITERKAQHYELKDTNLRRVQ